jgi:hypothetical protein
VGLFKSIGRAVKKVADVGRVVTGAKIIRKVGGPLIAATSSGITGGAIARLKPGLIGIKSASAKKIVATSQNVLIAAGASALAGGKLKSILPSGPTGTAAVTPLTPPPVNNVQEAVQERFIQHILKG